MPCKIQIKQNITNSIEEKTNKGFNKSLEGAQDIARQVNSEFGVKVVSFFQRSADYIDRRIEVPEALVDKYYEHERALEANEFAKGVNLNNHPLTKKPIGAPLEQSETIGICDGTCGLMANRLREAGMPYGSAHIADKYANYHAVALTEVDGKKYILNQPQHEFLGREYQKAPLWERAQYWNNMNQRFNRHLNELNDIYYGMDQNPLPALFNSVETEYGNIGPYFENYKKIEKKGTIEEITPQGETKKVPYDVITGTKIGDPSIRIAIKIPHGEKIENQYIEELDIRTTKDGEEQVVWTQTEFTPRFIEVTAENLANEYKLTEEQVAYSLKIINKSRINPNKDSNVSYQVSDMPMSVADDATIDRVKMVAEKMGVKLQDLADYLKGNPDIQDTGLNAVTDMFKNVIAIAQGKEGEAITEEVVHVASAILEQTNPELITSLIKEIGKFKIYKRVFDAYKGKKAYQLSNGKPNIRKIKREAVDKLIAEVIVQESPNSDANPELLKLTIIERIKNFWKAILNNISNKYTLAGLDMFETASSLIMDGNVSGNVRDIQNKDIYYQAGNNAIVDSTYNIIMEKAKDMVLHPETADKKRHYTKAGEEIKMSVTEMLANEKEKSGKAMADRTPEQQAVDKIKMEWGQTAHEFIEKYIKKNLIDSDGYARPTPLEIPINTRLSQAEQKIISDYIKSLISSYQPGTRFIIETFAINQAVKGGIASTIDFLALEPSKDKDGNDDVKVDILDWKFSGYDPEANQGDIPWYKQRDWKAQMSEYSRMLRNYGIKPSQLRKARMIPFKTTYKAIDEKNPTAGLNIKSIEIGNVDNLKESKLYLLPVATENETTGYSKLDTLIKGLRIQYSKLYDTFVSDEEKPAKAAELQQISKAIRILQMKHDFEPFLSVATTFSKRFNSILNEMDKADFNEMDADELLSKLKELVEVKNSAEKYLDLASTFELVYDKNDPKHVSIKNKLSALDDFMQKKMDAATEIQGRYAIQEAINRKLISEENKEEVLAPERAIDKISKSFLESSKLPAAVLNIASNMIMRVKDLIGLQYNEKMNEFRKILIPLEKVASAKGVKAFDLIAKKTKDGMTLIKKLDSNFINKVNAAKEEEDLAFLKDAMDMKKYEEMLAQTLKENIERIENRAWYPLDENANQQKIDYEIRKLKQRVDIKNKKFNGFKSTHFSYLFYNSIQEERFYSPEFKAINSDPVVLKAWEFFTELNKTAKSLGYLERNALSFFPLVEATTVEKFAQSKNPFNQVWDSIKDTVSMRVDEKREYGQIDDETGELKRTIPKYFTSTDKQVEQLSTNLDMVGSLWIKSILDYKASRELEYRLLTLYDVEKAKKNLAVSSNGSLVYEGDQLMTVEGENQNARVMRAMIDDAVYFIKEDLDSWGSQTISAYSNLRKGDKETRDRRALNVKKTFKTADVLFRALAIGLKPAIGLANYFGLQMQAFINGGEFYKFREFAKNNTLVTANALSKEKKALLHLFMPLNEDLVAEKRRDIAREKGSIMKWLSTWTFTDVMMSTNSFPERLLQYANAVSMMDNAMVVDGKIVNIRQHLREQDRKTKYNMSVAERKALEKSFNDRVNTLKETKALSKIVEISDDKITIPGTDLKALAEYRTTIKEYGRKLSGLMSEDNKMGYRRDTIMSSFMMFKSWMPKHLGTRILGMKKNAELNQWEYGKSRLFAKVALTLGARNIFKMRDIISGNEAGLELMRKLLEEKKASHFDKTGKNLDITEEEFFDLVRTELNNATKELLMVVNMTALYFTMAAAEPPEDVDASTLNAWKKMALIFNKTSDEIMFYYSPVAFTDFTSGNILPSLGLLTKTLKAFDHLWDETNGYLQDDEDLMNGAHPIKYFLNVVPGAAQFQNELLPLIYPEMAKDLGIKVSRNPFHR